MMKTTIVLESKADLTKERNNLKAKGFTEVRLEYRAGKYELTYITAKVDEEFLIQKWIQKEKEKINRRKCSLIMKYNKR